jgi:hypothetical protein
VVNKGIENTSLLWNISLFTIRSLIMYYAIAAKELDIRARKKAFIGWKRGYRRRRGRYSLAD